ncbi:peroxiredoxin family protein [Dethiobacter alkaliphilus]|uniref:peroxiredoxin family protein n=1 Tax=Dethiobacter alkaliphilus TaxID=427926 RepID=UPI002227F1BC|nr:TlpA disulfide reductase family protein [Dethiobacter alkaliphilus]MCW3491245.1 TlpA family protein disulfide reductase [Dethiobacter alkaliphilus]
MKKYIFVFVAIVLLGVAIPVLGQLRGEGLVEGKTAPDFTLPVLMEEETISLTDMRGQVVLVNFWSAACPPCREEKPRMQRLYEELGEKGFTILAVNVNDIPGMAKSYIDENNFTFPVLKDDGEVSELYEVVFIPKSLLIDRDGVVRHVQVGAMEEDQLRSLVQEWL